MNRWEALDGEWSRLEKRMVRAEERYKERQALLQRTEQEIRLLTTEGDVLTKTTQALLLISNKVLGKSTETIDKLVTSGLRTVFDDQDLRFVTRVEKARGKTALKFDLYHDGRTVPLLEGYGGGVLTVVGVLLRVTTILVLGLRRILILDESLSHVSPKYVPNAARLLKKISAELSFTVLLITHEQEFTKEADRTIEVGKQRGTEEPTAQVAAELA